MTLLGSAGVGKSRLVETLTIERSVETALVVRGHCLPYGEGITYWPIVEMIRQVAEIHHDDDTATISDKLGKLLEGLGSDDLDELRTMAVALANLDRSPDDASWHVQRHADLRGELHWGLRQILELGSQQLPLVLVIEDLQYAEPTLVDLIRFIFSSESVRADPRDLHRTSEFAEIGGEAARAGAEPPRHRPQEPDGRRRARDGRRAAR